MLRQVGPTWQRCCSSSASWIHTATLTRCDLCRKGYWLENINLSSEDNLETNCCG
jgi:hypothetical protein